MAPGKQDKYYNAFLGLVASTGLGITLFCAYLLCFQDFDWRLYAIAAFALVLGSRIAIKIEYTKTSISIIDVFTLLAFLRFNTEAAVVLAAVEAYWSSGRYSKSRLVRLFNAGALAISFFASFSISERLLIFDRSRIGVTVDGLILVALAVTIHYLVNTGIVAVASALRSGRSIREVWQADYVWMFVPFLASGSAALLSAGLINSLGFAFFLIVLPIVGILYFTYQSHHEKLEAATAHSRLVETHLVEMRESEERFRSAFSNAPIGIALISGEGRWLEVNEALLGILRTDEESLLNEPVKGVVHQADLIEFLAETGAVVKGRRDSFHAEMRFVAPDGAVIWTQTSVSMLGDSHNSRLICQVQDITARRLAEEKLRHNAFYDSLTDLANRHLFTEKLAEVLAEKPPRGEFAVLFVDLDRFKLVNDTVGHATGDKVLVSVANRLRNCVPDHALLARFASDEFLILIDRSMDREKVMGLVQEIERQMGLVFDVAGQEVNLSASIGVVFRHDSQRDAEDVLRDSQAALNVAKRRGRHCHVIFDEEMREAAIRQNQLERDLWRAIERNELLLEYQPIVGIGERSLRGFEALVRWKHPELGLIPPVNFISIAEENGFIIDIGEWVLNETCRQLREWDRMTGFELPVFVAINVSSRQLLHRNLFRDVIGALERHSVRPERLKLEITESIVVENTAPIISILKQFRAIGVKLSMDDFGTGYSSLSYLHRLPLDTLKIDRSFVSNLNGNNDSKEIVKTILVLARNLGLDVVAEGIEEPDQLEFLTKNGCDFGQGYYFAKPLGALRASEYIAKNLDGLTHEFVPTLESDGVQFEN